MWTLVYKELSQLRIYLIQTFGFLALALVVFGRTSPSMMMTYFYVFPVVMAMTIPQLSFAQEERGNTLAFLRSLPIRSWEIVASKYVLSFLTTGVFVAMIFLVGPYASMAPNEVLGAASVVTLVSLVLGGVSYLIHFCLGLKSAKVATMLLAFTAAIPTMIAVRSGGGLGAFVRWTQPLTDLAQTATGVLLAALAGSSVMAISWAVSTRIFEKRDISRMP